MVRGEAWRGEVDARRALYMRPASAAALHTLTQLHDALAPAHRHTDMARAQQAAVTAWVPPPQPPDLEAQHGVGADSKARLCCALLAVQDHMLCSSQASGVASRAQLELRASRSTRGGGGGAGCIRSRSFAASLALPARQRFRRPKAMQRGLAPRTFRRSSSAEAERAVEVGKLLNGRPSWRVGAYDAKAAAAGPCRHGACTATATPVRPGPAPWLSSRHVRFPHTTAPDIGNAHTSVEVSAWHFDARVGASRDSRKRE